MVNAPTLAIIGAIGLVILAIHCGIAYVLFRWAGKVANVRRTTVWRALRFVPIVGVLSLVASGPIAGWMALRVLELQHAIDPSYKARILAEGISEAINFGVLFALVCWVLFFVSLIASFVGSRGQAN